MPKTQDTLKEDNSREVFVQRPKPNDYNMYAIHGYNNSKLSDESVEALSVYLSETRRERINISQVELLKNYSTVQPL